MNIETFKELLFKKGSELKFTEMEIFYAVNKATSVNVQDKSIKNYTITEQGGVSFRGIYNGNMGYSYTEKLDAASIDFLLKEAIANAEIMEAADKEELFEGAKKYAPNPPVSDNVAVVLPQELIEAAFTLESAALAASPEVERVIQCKVNKSESKRLLANTKGLFCQAAYASISAGIYLMASRDNQTTTGGEHDFTVRNLKEINLLKIAQTAAKDAVSKLGAVSIASGNYPVVLYHDAATTLLGFVVSTLSGETVEKGFSRFKDRVGEKVGGANITLVEDPLMPGILGAAAFDAEGYPTQKIALIKEGILKTFMHNRKTAQKAGTISTGNAIKHGFAGPISVGPHNVYLEPGEITLDEMLGSIKYGIMITELQGMHAGINTVSGEFSLAARGFLIEDGKSSKPLKEITVAGNLYELLAQVEAIANDLTCKSAVSSPSLKITSLTVSGE